MGFTPVCDALSSAEVNRSYVGQTEQLLKDLLTRAHKLPHLMCMIAVDEIDGLAPKRDDKSSQSKNDALNILLAYVGGAKAVKNLVFMASTNRLKMMDEAFKRRISAQFFVGRPRPDIRSIILDKVNVDLKEQGCSRSVWLSERNLKDLVVWTTNFSGAALGALVSDLIVFATRALHNKPGMTFTNPMILGIVDKISQQFSLSVGAKSLANIFNEMLLRAGPDADDEYLDRNNDDSDDCHDNRGARNIMKMQLVRSKFRNRVHEMYTGLIVVDLQNGLIIRETKGDDKPHNEHEEHGPRTIDELLTMCVNFATKFELDAVQMFDLDLLLNNAAYDDTKCKVILSLFVDLPRTRRVRARAALGGRNVTTRNSLWMLFTSTSKIMRTCRQTSGPEKCPSNPVYAPGVLDSSRVHE
jgi:SpoVK/Ycf46/Vps4 family AAA+-type ATPase